MHRDCCAWCGRASTRSRTRYPAQVQPERVSDVGAGALEAGGGRGWVGHGSRHLATVCTDLMMLAFLIDPCQQRCCTLFQAAQAKAGRARYFRERLRALLFNAFLADWETLYKALASRVKRVVVHDTSQARAVVGCAASRDFRGQRSRHRDRARVMRALHQVALEHDAPQSSPHAHRPCASAGMAAAPRCDLTGSVLGSIFR